MANQKTIALTFDDGPNPPYTEALLEVLDKHGVKATFFMVGKNIQNHPEIAKKVLAAGHSVGNHTYSHKFSNNFLKPSFKNELAKTQQTFESVLNTKPTIFRPPWLLRNPLLAKALKKQGLTMHLGIFGHPMEVFQPAAKKMAQRAFNKSFPGAVLIFHDGYNAKGGRRDQTVAAIDLLIPMLKGAGYDFISL